MVKLNRRPANSIANPIMFSSGGLFSGFQPHTTHAHWCTGVRMHFLPSRRKRKEKKCIRRSCTPTTTCEARAAINKSEHRNAVHFVHTPDLGRHIRERVKKAFESGSKTNWDSEECQQQYGSLSRLADNKYRNQYRLKRHSTATGLSTDECNLILSTEVLAYLKEENKGLFRKIFNKD
ncbi:Ubiquinol-cytochrome-c reductase complex assembly factor 2 [Eumeta japonica]|uniref:Mitochondrial nucleoid factor 1 n=1 Tax=Eumeta variegata TaxID=151549 RepID=A0A4C1VQX1_EUMVA|nr:Ubiquinol-cytochrome-c reductase complex assembly factor 2 [Eumeta japonica]